MSRFSRRGFLKTVAAGAGAAIGTRIAGGASGLLGEARAATNGSAVVILHLDGGFNSLFVSADSFAPAGTFGVSPGNFTALGANVAIDNTWNTALPTYAKQHLAVLGVRHGLSDHDTAKRADWTFNNQNAALVLANAIGGTASLKAAIVGSGLIGGVPGGSVNGISFQQIYDMQSTIAALGGGTIDPRRADRAMALSTLTAAQAMSQNQLAANSTSLSSVGLAYNAAADTLRKPLPTTLTYADLRAAYGLGSSTGVGSFASKFAAAELMVRAGTNVVAVFDGGWDTHGDTDGAGVRDRMSSYVLRPMATFLNRMIDPAQNPTQNVSLVVMGDFARSLPGSDHQPNLSAAVFGRNVQLGTTGRVNATVSLPAGTPSNQGMWAYLGAIAKLDANPFGANPHGLVL